MIDMTPVLQGEEKTAVKILSPDGWPIDCDGQQFTAFSGSGFDVNSAHHFMGGDGLRYAIAIQQARDSRDYERADAMRNWVNSYHMYRVEAGKSSTTVHVVELKPPRLKTILLGRRLVLDLPIIKP